MFSIVRLVKAYKDKWHHFKEVQALTELAMLVQSGTSEADAKVLINRNRKKQFDWEKLMSSKFPKN